MPDQPTEPVPSAATPDASTTPAADPQDADLSGADLPAAAQRALAEAAERRHLAQHPELPTELGGRSGPEPVRYGDWERKGIAIDF